MIFSVLKPKGFTSYDVIRVLKKQFPKEKIGHGGTLDPLAEGVLVIAIGKNSTKKLGETLKNTKKTYVAMIELGASSDTYDALGVISKNEVLKQPNLKEITTGIQSLTGKVWQIPPLHSAVKIKGKPAYLYARKGQHIVLESKPVTLYTAEIVNYKYPFLELKLIVSSGFYVRSFANDLGKKLDTGALLYSLKRTAVGSFSINCACCLLQCRRDS